MLELEPSNVLERFRGALKSRSAPLCAKTSSCLGVIAGVSLVTGVNSNSSGHC